ncbi:MAG: response regulator [Methylobacterium mesophilicum]|nr:response regulator [Methylobacterium mesophilicum]
MTNLSGKRVLVVEDEFFLADDLAQALEKAGAEVVGPVPTLDEAMGMIESQPIDLAVIDINLQGEASFRVADALSDRGISFVFATGYDGDSIPPRHADVPRWEKPFDTATLIASLS